MAVKIYAYDWAYAYSEDLAACVISTGTRRRWTLEEKHRIVAESYSGPRLLSVTAQRNGLSASQLFRWRRLAGVGPVVQADEK